MSYQFNAETENATQHVCEKLVKREVIYCVSSLIADLIKLEPDDDDLLNFSMGEYDEEDYEYSNEPLEFWIVSDWFAEKLAEKGEATAELHGLTIWGRTTSGQAIFLDWVIKEIAHDMGILPGQENHEYWSK